MTERNHGGFSKPILFAALTCSVVLLILWLRIRLDDGKVLEYEVSPDGKYVAEYSLYNQTSATTTNLKVVKIRTRLNPFSHTILDALDYGADLSIKWIDARNLLVSCPESGGKLDFYGKDTKWRDIAVHYDLDSCQISGAVH